MSGDTIDNDEATIGRMLPYVWLSGRNKANAAARNRKPRFYAAFGHRSDWPKLTTTAYQHLSIRFRFS